MSIVSISTFYSLIIIKALPLYSSFKSILIYFGLVLANPYVTAILG
jgi:hypothetical protein